MVSSRRHTDTCVLALYGLLLLCLLGTVGCGTGAPYAGAVVPPWLLAWYPPSGGIASNVPVEMAFARGARLLHFSDTLPLPPTATTWLATSSTFGIALVRLDPAGQYEALALMNTTPGLIWEESNGT